MVLWHAILSHKPALIVHEDHQAMIKDFQSGRNPTICYLGRTHGVSAAWLHETCKGADLILAYEVSACMSADIYTKAFTDPEKPKSACLVVGVCDPKELDELAKRSKEWKRPLPQSGGTAHSPNS